jgi:putative ABC transport system ATP-binding protein
LTEEHQIGQAILEEEAASRPGNARPNEVVRLEQVHRIYQTGEIVVHALRGVSLAVGRGEMVAIMGPSGSGKSTLMNIIGCLDKPTRGRYFLSGIDVSTLTKDDLADIRNQKIGFVFQSLNLVPRTSALENVALPLVYAGASPAEQIRRGREALAAVNLSDRENNLPSQLSGGQQQRVAIARALVNNPAILIADEPTGSLDTRSSLEVMEILQRLNRERELTTLLVTHEADIARHARRLISIRDGRVRLDTAVEDPLSAAQGLVNLPPEQDEDYEVLDNHKGSVAGANAE